MDADAPWRTENGVPSALWHLSMDDAELNRAESWLRGDGSVASEWTGHFRFNYFGGTGTRELLLIIIKDGSRSLTNAMSHNFKK